MTDETPEAAYRLLHERVAGRAPAGGDRSLSAAQYDVARSIYLQEHGIVAKPGVAIWPPTSQTVMKRLGGGSWARAMEALGLTTNAGRSRGAGAFTDDDYRSAVRAFLDVALEEKSATSFAAYTAWAKTQGVGGQPQSDDGRPAAAIKRPSGAAVRQHFGSWSAAVEAAGVEGGSR